MGRDLGVVARAVLTPLPRSAVATSLPARPLLIGEQPAPSAVLGPGAALTGNPARTLLNCVEAAGGAVPAAKTPDEWLTERFRTANVIKRKTAWSPYEARKSASVLRVREIDPRGDLVVLLGRRVSAAFGFPGREWFDSWTDGRVRYWLAPHPSGKNRLLNDPATRTRVGEVLIEALAASASAAPYDSEDVDV